MRLGTVVASGGESQVIVDAGDGTAVALPGYSDVADVLADPGWRTAARAALDAASSNTSPNSTGSSGVASSRLTVTELSWLPPVRRPGKVLCVALNNSANPDRIMSGPSTPAMFTKPSSSLIGHGQPVRVREDYGRVHPEPEMAVIIGTPGTDIAEAEALSHVFGYTVINDLTSPTMRDADTFHYRAIHPDPNDPNGVRYVESWVSYPARYKGADTFGPMGPWVVTADDIPDPHTLTITCRHDGRLITEDNTANLRFSVAQVIAFASSYLTLEAGDVIAMGTALKKSATGGAVQNVDLVKLGGVIEVEIENIGTLSNPVERR